VLWKDVPARDLRDGIGGGIGVGVFMVETRFENMVGL